MWRGPPTNSRVGSGPKQASIAGRSWRPCASIRLRTDVSRAAAAGSRLESLIRLGFGAGGWTMGDGGAGRGGTGVRASATAAAGDLAGGEDLAAALTGAAFGELGGLGVLGSLGGEAGSGAALGAAAVLGAAGLAAGFAAAGL